MTTSEWLSTLALIIATGGFAINLRNWFLSGPRLHLSVIADAISIPDDGHGPRLALTVINRGNAPTLLTHMVGYIYSSPWRKWRDKPALAGIIASDRIPSKIEINATWMGFMHYQ